MAVVFMVAQLGTDLSHLQQGRWSDGWSAAAASDPAKAEEKTHKVEIYYKHLSPTGRSCVVMKALYKLLLL